MKRVHKKFLCHPRDKIKLLWDIFASIVLVVACFMTPFGLAFDHLDQNEEGEIFSFHGKWSAVESIVDMVFLVEIIVCFNTSYYDAKTNEFESSRCIIAKNYLFGWFWIDFLAIVPRFIRPLEVGDLS